MNWNSLCNMDDLVKVLIVSNYVKNVRKIKERQLPFLESVQSDSKYICDEFSKSCDINKTVSAFIELAFKYKLFYFFNIPSRKWFCKYSELYLNFFHPQSLVKLERCNRYSTDGFNGVKVVAKKNLKQNMLINCLFGVYKKIDANEDKILANINVNFSLLASSSSSKLSIFLGTIAFVNHRCEPNCRYKSKTKDMAVLEIIKDVAQDEELFVKYSNGYFGIDNVSCECDICEQKNRKYKSLLHYVR